MRSWIFTLALTACVASLAGCKSEPASDPPVAITEEAPPAAGPGTSAAAPSSSIRFSLSAGSWSPRFIRTCASPDDLISASADRVIVCRSEFDEASGQYLGEPRDPLWRESHFELLDFECPDGDEPARLGEGIVCLGHERGDDGAESTRIRSSSGELRFSVPGRFAHLHEDSERRVVLIGEQEVRWVTPAGGEILHARSDAPLKFLSRLPNDGLLIKSGDETQAWSLEGQRVTRLPVSRPITRVVHANDDRLIVVSEQQLELWTCRGSAIEIEPLTALPGGSRNGERVEALFTKSGVVVQVDQSVLWLSRQAASPEAVPRLSASEQLEGCPRLQESEAEGGYEIFQKDTWIINRNPADLSAHLCAGELVRVSRSDSSELSAYEGDAWARAGADLYAMEGGERWVKWWRDAEGRRTLVAHFYVGGCERTHHLVALVENGTALERYETYGTKIVSFLEVPDSARSVEIADGSFIGDPSIGHIDE